MQNFSIPFEGFEKIVFFAFDATVWGHIDVADFHQRGFGFRGPAGLKQF